MTDWSVVKTVKDIIVQIIIRFLIKEIFMYYKSLKELLSDNKTNLKVIVVKYYLQKIITCHYNITIYYS